MKYIWQDLPEKKTVFTVRSATMRNIDNGKIMRYYSANTRIDVVQKCVTEDNTYYRTQSAVLNNLNWAFEASAFGLPNEAAPSVPFSTPPNKLSTKKTLRKSSSTENKKKSKTPALTKDGEPKATKKSLRTRFFSLFKK